MILKEKFISDKTMLKLVASILRKADLPKGYKVATVERRVEKVTAEEVIDFVESLAEALYTGDYAEVKRCDICGKFFPQWCSRGRGWCTEFTGYKNSRDFCSAWIPMTEEQKYDRRKMREFRASQTQRAGNVSKNRHKGN